MFNILDDYAKKKANEAMFMSFVAGILGAVTVDFVKSEKGKEQIRGWWENMRGMFIETAGKTKAAIQDTGNQVSDAAKRTSDEINQAASRTRGRGGNGGDDNDTNSDVNL
ncbi:MAG: hypothetical protein OHK0017_05130 [Patescibacteria group bacterium]